MNFSKCSVNSQKYGELFVLQVGTPLTFCAGDLPEDDTDKGKDVDLSHSVNNEDDDMEKKPKEIMLQPVSGSTD